MRACSPSRLPSWPGLRSRLLARLDERGCGINLRKDDGDEVVFALLPAAGGSASPLLLTDAPAEPASAPADRSRAACSRRSGSAVSWRSETALR